MWFSCIYIIIIVTFMVSHWYCRINRPKLLKFFLYLRPFISTNYFIFFRSLSIFWTSRDTPFRFSGSSHLLNLMIISMFLFSHFIPLPYAKQIYNTHIYIKKLSFSIDCLEMACKFIKGLLFFIKWAKIIVPFILLEIKIWKVKSAGYKECNHEESHVNLLSWMPCSLTQQAFTAPVFRPDAPKLS